MFLYAPKYIFNALEKFQDDYMLNNAYFKWLCAIKFPISLQK